jgi:hypothetical protein
MRKANDQQTDTLVAAAASLAAIEKRNELIPHLVLREMLGMTGEGQQRYHSMVSRLKKMLISEHQVFLSVQMGKGYVVLPDNEAHTVPQNRLHRAVKQIGRAVVEYNHIPVAKLESSERDALIQESQKAGTLFGMMRKAITA